MKTFYLELKSRKEFIHKTLEDPTFSITESIEKNYKFNRFLYRYVGEKWNWNDKLTWTDTQWREYAEDTNLRTFVGYKSGTPAGYYELHKVETSVEIAYFGLEERFIGKGLGGALLSHAIGRAWDWEASRVWVHTCELDHPSALVNYQLRGFTIFRVSDT